VATRYFSRWFTVPHREPAGRIQCEACKGGGEINQCFCTYCDGRGWFDAANRPSAAYQASKKASFP